MKEFWYKKFEDYLEMANANDNPKTVKMYELVKMDAPNEGVLRAVTYLRTSLIGWQMKIGQEEYNAFKVKLENAKHRAGIILEVGRLE